MKDKLNLIIKNKIFIIVLFIILFLLVGTAGTYAWFTWSNPSSTNLTMTIGNLDVFFETGNHVNVTTLSPVYYPTEGAKTTFSIKKNNSSLGNLAYTISLDINTISNELKSSSFKWTLMKKDSTSIISQGNFSSASNGGSLTLYNGVLLGSDPVSYDLYIYIDGNSENDANMINKTLTGVINIYTNTENIVTTLASTITDLYTDASKTTVTNNNITYNYANIYDTDDDENTSGGLMNDRLGSSTTDINGGNIRYYGANPNNYIYFNCSDYSNQSDTTCEKWRIIGVFDGKVKIIRNSTIGNYSWDNNITSTGAETDSGKNDWTTATLMKLLNPSDYYTEDSNDNDYGQSLYYNGQSGTCFSGQNNATTTCNFTSIGLKNNTTRNMISIETYYLRGYNFSSVYSDQMYNYERTTGSIYSGRPTSWNGKIALAYPSDYGYAADFNYCTQNLFNYNNSTCTSNNWMKNILGISSLSWLLTPYSSNTFYAWYVNSSGAIPTNYYNHAFNSRGVVPVLSLNSVLEVEASTTGTSTNPYKLVVQ